MANPGLTQAAFNYRWERASVVWAMWKALREARKRFSEEVVRVFNDNDFNANFASDVTLTGANLGVNTSAEGYIYVRVTGVGPYTVSLYKATGGVAGNKVAEGSAAASAVATLAEQNSSGLSGSVTLGGSVTAETDDVHKLRIFPDVKLLIDSAFDKDIDRDGDMERALLEVAGAVERGLRGLERRVVGAFTSLLQSQLGPAVKSGYSEQGLLLNREPTVDDGAVSVAFTGLLEDLRLGAKNNDSGGALPQTVVQILLSAAAVSYETGNVGSGTTPTATIYEHQEAGTWQFSCVDDTIGQQEFEARFTPSDASRANKTYTSPLRLRVKKEWKDPGADPSADGAPRVGVQSLTIDYARTIANVVGASLSTTATDWSETGETADTTDSGKLYATIAANGGNWDVSFYSDSNKPSSSLVAKATGIAAAASFTATERNGSGLTVVGKLGASPADADTGTVDLNVFSSDGRADGDPDRFEFVVSETSAGKIQTFFAEAYGYRMHSAASGSETVDEDYGTRGGALLIP